MGTIPHVLHTGARPIATHEFAEALRAICPPRFPSTTRNPARLVALAVSGGVDSMALAYLCSRLLNYDPNFVISDNPVFRFRALVVDHQLREGSSEEAGAVGAALRKMGMSCEVSRLSWKKLLRQGPHPSELPNLETVARRLRYQRLGERCRTRRIASILFAHHQDDQYETVLMRLLQGHGARGLRGMRAASDIPECEGMYGAYQSGYVDDQMNLGIAFYNNGVSRKQSRALRRDLRSSMDQVIEEQERRESTLHGLDDYDFEELYQTRQALSPDISNIHVEAPVIDIEDGGVMVYRPLLEFSKDRLVATCEANRIPWWEDGTNQDPTLTMRNAVRHMYKNHALPAALQKPSILALARRCSQRAQALEAEADRLLAQTIMHDVQPNVGTAYVQFPEYDLSRFPRDTSPASRRRARVTRQREVAGLLVRKVAALVSPEPQRAPLASWQDAISRLFPALSLSTDKQSVAEMPRAFAVAGVWFVPVGSHSDKDGSSRRAGASPIWYLSRTPYTSHQPMPRYRTPYWSGGWGRVECRYKWSDWTRWGLWDGRFWVRLRHRLPYRVILQPFFVEHAKAFRELLPPEDRRRLAALLKRYAPGKTRYTLPALYLDEDLDLDNAVPRPNYPLPPSTLQWASDARVSDKAGRKYQGNTDPTSNHPRVPDTSKMKLIGLPSLDIQIPGLGAWLEYKIRARRLDRAVIDTAGSFRREPFVPPRSRLIPAPTLGPVLQRSSRRRRGKLMGRRRWSR